MAADVRVRMPGTLGDFLPRCFMSAGSTQAFVRNTRVLPVSGAPKERKNARVRRRRPDGGRVGLAVRHAPGRGWLTHWVGVAGGELAAGGPVDGVCPADSVGPASGGGGLVRDGRMGEAGSHGTPALLKPERQLVE